jgi:mandelate racemase
MALDDEGIYWIEEPIRHDDYRHLALRSAGVAAAYHREVSSHVFPEVSAHLMATTPGRN